MRAMHSELFTLFGFHLQMYGLMLALGFVSCYFLARRLARLTGRDPGEVDTLIMVAAIGGVVGARAVYVAQNWGELFANDPLAAFMLWRGGLVFYGGFAVAALGIVAYGLLRREPLRRLLDFCVVFVPLGHAFGRLGCFFHGCCFGGVGGGALGVCFPHGSPAWQHQVSKGLIGPYAPQALPVWPTQLIEAAGCALLFVALLVFGVVMAVRPPLLLATRAGLVRRWFAQRGAASAGDDPLAELVADYTVTLSAFGFTETSSTATLNIPWFALDARPVAGDNGTYFVLAKGKEASLAYNLMGINWAFRDEDASGALFLPREFVEKNPGLVDEVSSAVKGARQRYLGHGKRPIEDERLAAWLAAK